MLSRLIGVLIGVSLLSSCANEAEQRAQAQAAAQAQANADDAQCRSYGATQGSSVYVQCRMNLDNQRAAADENTRALATQVLISRGF